MGNGADEDIAQMNTIVERARTVDEHGHGLCPMCGGKMEIWVERMQPDGWAGGVEDGCLETGWPGWTEPTEEAAERRIWEAWDRAWWRGGR